MLLALIAVKEKGDVILKIYFVPNIRRGLSGVGSQLNPTDSSVSDFPVAGVFPLAVDNLHGV